MKTSYRDHALFLEQVKLSDVADQFGTPCYVYSKAAILANWKSFQDAANTHPHRICYAVKANSNLAILQLLVKQNAGFDIVSLGELERVLAAGGKPEQIVFSGVGKSSNEIKRALAVGIHCFNVESASELQRIHQIAKSLKIIARITLRINPNIDAKTHPHIATGLTQNKFGIHLDEAQNLIEQLSSYPYLQLVGLGCHIGSQLTEMQPILEAVDTLIALNTQLAHKQIHLEHINIGGGLGVIYHEENPPLIREYVSAILNKLKGNPIEVIFEPGRAIVANTGVLLTSVTYLKHNANHHFAIVDAAMNDLIRPALYDAYHEILPLQQDDSLLAKQYDIVGPICETADILGKSRTLAIKEGDRLAICGAGAYGFCMSSNYNSRPRVAEILIDGNHTHLIRQRETAQELWAHEKLI